MGKKATRAALTKKQVTAIVECDTSRLYDKIDNAIAYLREISAAYPNVDLRLNENWTGYEDMNMQFGYQREETDDEFERRVEQERAKRALDDDRQQRDAVRRQKEEQFERLRRELGR